MPRSPDFRALGIPAKFTVPAHSKHQADNAFAWRCQKMNNRIRNMRLS